MEFEVPPDGLRILARMIVEAYMARPIRTGDDNGQDEEVQEKKKSEHTPA
jgi:hypothetical protein